MEKNYVLARKHMPYRSPIVFTIVMYLFMDHVHSPQWVWGAVGLFVLIMWITYFVGIHNEKEVIISPKDEGLTLKDKPKN